MKYNILFLSIFSVFLLGCTVPVDDPSVDVPVEDGDDFVVFPDILDDDSVNEFSGKGYKFEYPDGFEVKSMDGGLALHDENGKRVYYLELFSLEPAEVEAILLDRGEHSRHSMEITDRESRKINGSDVTMLTTLEAGLVPMPSQYSYAIFDNPVEYLDDRGEWTAVLYAEHPTGSSEYNASEFDEWVESFELY